MGIIWMSNDEVWNWCDPKISLVSPVSTIRLWLTFWHYHLSTEKCNKVSCTVFPNHLGQMSLPQASMLLMTSLHHSQFNCSILMEVGQIAPDMFPNVAKNHDPSQLWVQKSNRMKWYPNKNGPMWLRTYWVKPSSDPRLWPVWPLLTIHLWLTFPTVTFFHKTVNTASPNKLGQSSLPWASMALSTFHDPYCPSQI